jgi:DNA-binding NarL/FixJ family response regulator
LSVVRILIADDSGEMRDFISYLLVQDGRFEVVGHAYNGLHAVDLAVEMKPAVILLDIQMPGLNGLDAARQIVAREPNSRIVFVTGEADQDVASAAFEIGASGYVLKANANRDLMTAIDAAINGDVFVSDGVLNNSPAGEGTEQNKHRIASPITRAPKKFSCGDCWH